jgi:Protein of unknown function (DUF2924)
MENANMASEIAKELAALERLPVGRLRERYAEVFGEPTNTFNRPWLVRRIAWRLQERAEGGLSDRAKKRAEEIADDADLRIIPPRPSANAPAARDAMPDPAPLDPRLPLAGTVLTRPYKGGVLQVHVLADGFEYDGATYGSLSAVAKAATGSHCNGFAFFSLAGKGAKK